MNKYEKLRLVGRGAYGTVFLCNRLDDDKRVILKEIPVDQMSIDERQASINEAKVLSMLDHPNIVGYYESFLEEKTMTIVMEYVQGGTLYDFLKQRDGTLLEEREVLHFFGQMVYTLRYNQKSDIWALGCLLYELMTLKRPFDASTLPALVMKIMKGTYDPVPDIYSPELKKLLMSMLHLDPNHRPSAAEIMCQPFMIHLIFKLYVDIGSIPCTNRLKKMSKTSASGLSFGSSMSASDSLFSSVKMKEYAAKFYDSINVTYFENSSTNAILLPSAPKGIIKSVSLGANHKIGLTSGGLLVSWQISSPVISVEDECNNQEIIRSPTYISSILDEKFAVNITSVASGNDFTICQSDNGVIFSFGKASSGCLGHASNKDITEPKIIEALFSHNIISVACGPKHVLAVSDENRVFSWGCDTHGCLGLGESELQILPKEVEILSENHKPEKVFCGPDCSFIISDEKFMLACGNNRHNKLALDSGEGHQIDNSNVFTLVCLDLLRHTKMKSVSAGKNHTVILCDNNDIYSVGSNQFFQLGWGQIGSNYSMPGKIEKLDGLKFMQISCSDYFTVAVTDDHSLYCWGKCPKSFNGKEEICFVESPLHFSKKSVLHVSCDSENCLVLTKEKHC